MNAVTVWLLMSMASGYMWSHSGAATPPAVIERFTSREECERVSKWLQQNRQGNAATIVGCIEAKVYKP